MLNRYPINRNTLNAARPLRRVRYVEDAASVSDDGGREARWTVLATESQALLDAFIKNITGGAGGSTFTEVRNELLAVADEALRRLLRVRQMTETLTAVDSAVWWTRRARLLTETLGVADEALESIRFARTAADTLALQDESLRTRYFTRLLSEALAIADETLRARVLHRLQTETTSVADDVIRQRLRIALLSESLSIEDAAIEVASLRRVREETLDIVDERLSQIAGGPIIRVATDALSIVDQILRVARWSRVLSDSVVVLDNALAGRRTMRLGEDVVSIGDGLTRFLVLRRVAEEGVAAADELIKSVLRAGGINVIVLSEALTVTDARGAAVTITRRQADTIATADEFTRARLLAALRTDTLQISEAVIQQYRRVRVLLDQLTLIDGTATIRWSRRIVSDSIGDLPDAVIKLLSSVLAMRFEALLLTDVEPIMDLGMMREWALGYEPLFELTGVRA